METKELIVKMFDVAASEEFIDLLAVIGDFAAEVSQNASAEFVALWKMSCREPLFLRVKSGERPTVVEFDTTDKSYFVKWAIGEESGCLYYDDERFDLPAFAVSAIEGAIKLNTESTIKKVEWGVEATLRILGITYHDFRNTFGAVTGVMQLLEMDEGGNKRVQSALGSVRGILSDFDGASKLTMLILRNEPICYQDDLVDITSIYNTILAKNKKVFAYSQVDLDYEVDEDIKTKGDEQKITQILSELLVNASDSFENSETGGKINVRVSVENLNCVISVADTGFGMDYHLQRYLTTKFFTRKFKRPGLGLTRVRRFVEDWGGYLQFASVPEKGTSITVRFPIIL